MIVCYFSQTVDVKMSVPIPLLVDLLEVDAVLEDSPAAGEEEHAAEGEPCLVNEASEE